MIERLNKRAHSALVLSVVALCCGGCLQLEITVAMHDDDGKEVLWEVVQNQSSTERSSVGAEGDERAFV